MNSAQWEEFAMHVNKLVAIVSMFMTPSDQKWRTGGWLVVRYAISEDRLLIVNKEIGTIREDKTEKYVRLAHEKARRLIAFAGVGHRTSRESRDTASSQFGGAVLAGHYALSFSGFSEEWDEAMMLYAAFRYDLLTIGDVRAIATPAILSNFHEFVAVAA